MYPEQNGPSQVTPSYYRSICPTHYGNVFLKAMKSRFLEARTYFAEYWQRNQTSLRTSQDSFTICSKDTSRRPRCKRFAFTAKLDQNVCSPPNRARSLDNPASSGGQNLQDNKTRQCPPAGAPVFLEARNCQTTKADNTYIHTYPTAGTPASFECHFLIKLSSFRSHPRTVRTMNQISQISQMSPVSRIGRNGRSRLLALRSEHRRAFVARANRNCDLVIWRFLICCGRRQWRPVSFWAPGVATQFSVLQAPPVATLVISFHFIASFL